MFNKGNIVERITTPLEGGIAKGTLCIVKKIIDDTYMELEGHNGQFRQGCFVLRNSVEEAKTNQTVSDLASVVNALNTIDAWNKVHPTGMMIGVEPYPTQDGGMVVTVANEGFNDINEFYNFMSHHASTQDRQAAIQLALKMLQAEVK